MDIYGSTILIWMGINPVLLTRDPKIAEDILISSQCLNRASNITKPISDTFESGLLTLRGTFNYTLIFKSNKKAHFRTGMAAASKKFELLL